MNKLAVLVDGSSFIYRAYYALPQLTSDGKSIGAIYGFCSMLISLLEKHKSDLFLVALDSCRHTTFRSELYTEYKSNRSDTPEELKSQFPILREACEAFGLPTVERQGFEADDIIATYAEKLSAQGYDVRILSSDKDLMQLINDNVSLFDPIKSKVIKAPEVVEKYGVTPDKMVFLQALMGDSSDNVPGVSGVGPKTAAKLLNEYGTLEDIYQHLDNIKQEKLRNNLATEKDKLDVSLQLVTLRKDVEVDEDTDHLKITENLPRTLAFLTKYKLDSLIKRIGKNVAKTQAKKRNRFPINSVRDLHNFFELNRVEKFSFFCASSSNENGVLALCCENAVGYCCFSYSDGMDLFNQCSALTYSDVQRELKKYFENPKIVKIGSRNMTKYFSNADFASYEDISVMSYILFGPIDENVGSLFPDSDNAVCKLSFKNISDVEQVVSIAELEYDNYEYLKKKLRDEKLWDVYNNIDRPLIKILRDMEENGIIVSAEELQKAADEFSEKLAEIEAKIFAIAGCEFNVGSVKQLSEIMFDKLQIPAPSKKSLDMESLEELSVYGEMPALVIEWRKLSKLLSTYTTSLSKLINRQTGRVHTTFNITATVTGRLSSSNPNLQNIPVKTAYGKRIKQAFVSEKGHQLLSFDYSQIELRVLAHVANIKLLQEAFRANHDVHAITAANVFNVKLEDVTPEMRSYAKTINFGIIYGMSSFGLAKMLKVSREQAAEYIRGYFEKIPEFKSFQQETLEFARKNGYVQTYFGRRCYIKDITSKNYQLRQFSERQAVNAVIQGTAADIVKMAMIKVSEKLQNLHSKMLLQIHDELVFETENDFVDAALTEIKNIMERAVDLSVPLEVTCEYGNYLK